MPPAQTAWGCCSNPARKSGFRLSKAPSTPNCPTHPARRPQSVKCPAQAAWGCCSHRFRQGQPPRAGSPSGWGISTNRFPGDNRHNRYPVRKACRFPAAGSALPDTKGCPGPGSSAVCARSGRAMLYRRPTIAVPAGRCFPLSLWFRRCNPQGTAF